MERDGGGGRNPSEDLTFSEKKKTEVTIQRHHCQLKGPLRTQF